MRDPNRNIVLILGLNSWVVWALQGFVMSVGMCRSGRNGETQAADRQAG